MVIIVEEFTSRMTIFIAELDKRILNVIGYSFQSVIYLKMEMRRRAVPVKQQLLNQYYLNVLKMYKNLMGIVSLD